MIIQVILILGLLLCVGYSLLQRRKSRLISTSLMAVAGAGIVFVLFPELTNQLARWAGVGRGADLVLYCWIVISLIISINLQFKIVALQKHVTDLTRELSLKHPLRPNS